MRLTINQEACSRNGVSFGEILILLALANSVDLGKSRQILISKGLITSSGNTGNIDFRITQKGSEVLSNCIVDSIDYEKSKEDRLVALAEKLRELYPTGRKDGTNYMWRGTTAEIVRKLKTLETKYKFHFTDEQAISATKRYIQSFNGNYRFMQLLKYFILKAASDSDGNIEVKSEFMSLIENEGQVDSQRDDWVSTMV